MTGEPEATCAGVEHVFPAPVAPGSKCRCGTFTVRGTGASADAVVRGTVDGWSITPAPPPEED